MADIPKLRSVPGAGQFTSSGGGDGEDMNLRLTKLETKIEAILPTLATKADISDSKLQVIVVLIAALALFATILIFAINRVFPHQPAAQPTQPAPIVIYPQSQPVPQSPPETKREPKGRPASRE